MGARSPAAGAEAGSRDQRVELAAISEGISGQLWKAGARALAGGGAEGTRTPDPLRARQVLSQLSYSPVYLQSRRDDSRKWLDAQRKESLDRIECSRPLRGSPGSKRPPPPPLDQRGTLPSTQRPSPAPCERRALPQDERPQRAEVAKATGVRPTVATHGAGPRVGLEAARRPMDRPRAEVLRWQPCESCRLSTAIRCATTLGPKSTPRASLRRWPTTTRSTSSHGRTTRFFPTTLCGRSAPERSAHHAPRRQHGAAPVTQSP